MKKPKFTETQIISILKQADAIPHPDRGHPPPDRHQRAEVRPVVEEVRFTIADRGHRQ